MSTKKTDNIPDDVRTQLNIVYKLSKKAEEHNNRLRDAKQELMDMLKHHGLTTDRFRYPDRIISFIDKDDLERFSQKYVLSKLKECCPEDAQKIMDYMLEQRQKKKTQYIQVSKDRGEKVMDDET